MIFAVLVALSIPLSLIGWLVTLTVRSVSHDINSYESWPVVSPLRWLLSFILPVLITSYGVQRKSIKNSTLSILATLVIGFFLTLANFCFCTSLLAFFFSSSRLTKLKARTKKQLDADYREGGQRDWVQALCNCGVATQMAILYMVDGGCGERVVNFSTSYSSSWLSMAVLGSLACCSGDTWASEVGSVFGRGDPWLITTWERVPRGTNGALSVVGVVASACGGAVVGLAYYATLILALSSPTLADAVPQWPVVMVAAAAGLLGSLLDSYIGANFQFSGLCRRRGCVVEYPGEGVKPICGRPLLDNHGVNLVSSLLTALATPSLAFHIWHQAQAMS